MLTFHQEAPALFSQLLSMTRANFWLSFVALAILAADGLGVETLRKAETLEEQLKSADPNTLARIARERGDPRRGAIVYYTSAAACVNCHLSDEGRPPLGPELSLLGELSDTHIIESLIDPSKSIRKGYETVAILTDAGEVISGMIVRQDEDVIRLRITSNLDVEKVIERERVEAIRVSGKSMMPEGLIASIREQRDFMDLARYVMEVAAGGPSKAVELQPSAEAIQPVDDTIDLDHAGIIQELRKRDFEAGERIYQGYCSECHGKDGNTPSLPTARAFGSQKLKFGSDPYQMFLTLSRGNGLMAPMRHLTPHERYQVVHYVREQFMKPTNPDYFKVDSDYLMQLPKGARTGSEIPLIERDYGPALASQLRRDYPSVLTIRLGEMTIAYDLHTMNQAGVWSGGFLDLSNTQHVRDRGEGTANPQGTEIRRLSGWSWGHQARLDYPSNGLPPRGPLPEDWMDYRGYYRFGQQVLLCYSIDGRAILETPSERDGQLVHRMEIRPGAELKLCVADGASFGADAVGIRTRDGNPVSEPHHPALSGVATAVRHSGEGPGGGVADAFIAATVTGDIDGFSWHADSEQRLVLTIPASDRIREVEIVRAIGSGQEHLREFVTGASPSSNSGAYDSLQSMTRGGPPIWPDVIETVGYLGLETKGYALDTLTLPDQTPWNTWFRTSALDFFPDGRMALATYGGDIWIVSGIDRDLKSLKWKRFAGGLYEPMGVKVVDNKVYVTCKDRLVRLHDLNRDGEADFYESFSADPDVSVNFHAFNFDLQTDHQGNFYYAKSGHGSDADLPGVVFKISPDGKRREVYCTGFRTPNGMGMLPDGRPLASDNQGQWMPASKINLLEPGGFYGWVQTYSVPGMWAPGGGTIDLEKVEPPESFDPPLVWMPQDFDNSSGGQLWVEDPRFGPLAGHLLHTSFGKGWMSYLMTQQIGDTTQAAIIKLPFDFRTGIMRARVNPADGQVYATGLQGWNGGGRVGLRDSGVQRLRFTGKADLMVVDCRVEHDGLRVKFNEPLDVDASTRVSDYVAKRWNYRWRREYGSDMYSPTTGEIGAEDLPIESVSLGVDGRSVKLRIPNLVPVDQLHLMLRVRSQSGRSLEEEIYWTIHKIPAADDSP